MADTTDRPLGLDLSQPTDVHVIYVGGKAMSAIAEILVAMGHTVSGSDPNDVPVLARLRDLGISVSVGPDTTLPPAAEVVIRSTAVADDHLEVLAAVERGIPVIGRPAAQGAIARTRRTIAVSGTHGKTSTTAMLVHVLEATGRRPSYIVGGDLAGTAGGARWTDGEWFVVEADESDGTFLELGAERVVVTNIAADHLDHWGSLDAIAEGFDRFVAQADAAVVSGDDALALSVGERHGARTFGFGGRADVRIVDLEVERARTTFALEEGGERVAQVELPEPGAHNALNATAALVLATDTGVPWDEAAAALATYGGVGRRFETRGEARGITVVDDYAHNPGKVAAVVDAASRGGWGRVVVVFQPHRYSRTADLWEEFGQSFDGADMVVVTELDPAGEAPRAGVSGSLVVDALHAVRPDLPVTWVPERSALVDHLVAELRPGDLCLTLGAGDITTLPDALLPRIRQPMTDLDLVAGRLGTLGATDAPLGSLTTYRVGGRAALLVRASSVEDLRTVAGALAGTELPVVIVGRGSNMLVADGGFAGLAVVLDEGLASVAVEGRDIVAGGAASLPVVARRSAAAALTGFEWAVGVPGSIGGAVRMNAGGHGSDMAATLTSIHVVDLRGGEDGEVPASALDLGYRHSNLAAHRVVVSARLTLVPGDRAESEQEIAEIVRWRRANQPGGQNAGSVFTNPVDHSAGRLIDAAGCKGLRIGSAEVSTKHANFIQSDDGGRSDDVLALMAEVRRRVQLSSGVDLRAETRLVGVDAETASSVGGAT